MTHPSVQSSTIQHSILQSSADIVRKIGETDQQFLTNPTPELAKIRAHLRVQLIQFSHQKTEQVYFLTEAAALLEIALMEVGNFAQHVELSAALGETYLQFYHVTKEQRYLVISKQVIKPLSHCDSPDILLALARLSATEKHSALVKHWLSRLMQLPTMDVNSIRQAAELDLYRHEDWFKELLKPHLH
ncbi:hypothetical protein BKE30_12330 [Alkanindiges hydrocarboniclasticus]|jgi:hypothetical protein|uniref:Uncharacterized protein n=1 Tax=Alkanindiges hydrocarboniclasticus TaxID=1907941 RepID=A0A1S8CTE1_9GAMM|nr:hypothetical protein [Alkanindiges hydrocarboniclasticus]ONG38444.1 hypothetical protein BKE30_12330 [Alkanindiges hydrocarboniclasticus]